MVILGKIYGNAHGLDRKYKVRVLGALYITQGIVLYFILILSLLLMVELVRLFVGRLHQRLF